jgi:hypothetical protein
MVKVKLKIMTWVVGEKDAQKFIGMITVGFHVDLKLWSFDYYYFKFIVLASNLDIGAGHRALK